MWVVEFRVEDPADGRIEWDKLSGFSEKNEAIKAGTLEIRRFFKTCWSQEIPHINSVIFTEGVGIVGFINFWEEN